MATKDTQKYLEAVGRRKSSIARVRLYPSKKGTFTINDRELKEFFPVEEHVMIVQEALKRASLLGEFDVSVKVIGGGITGQAEAIRLGIARCLVKHNPDLRKDLKAAGYLKRDPRIVERKKPGLKKARKAAQWSKR